MRLTQEVIDKIAVLMQHTKMNGDVNWKDGDDIDVCLALSLIHISEPTRPY